LFAPTQQPREEDAVPREPEDDYGTPTQQPEVKDDVAREPEGELASTESTVPPSSARRKMVAASLAACARSLNTSTHA
jgi:hypothetical protein